jgi:subtilisin family serine protease
MGNQGGAVQVVLALVLVAFSGGLLVFGVPATDGGDSGAPSASFEAFVERPADTVDQEVEVVAALKPGVAVSEALRSREDVTVAGSGDRRQLRGRLSLSEVRSLSDAQGVVGVRIDNDAVDVRDGGTAPGAVAVGATELHARGITGENVTVGVVDEGFRISHPAVADQVGAYRAFGETGGVGHGTAVASVVADTAPDATLHFAAVGPTTTPEEYRRAVAWLRASGVDVIVDSGSYLADDGRIAAVAGAAADDVAFVTSAGNYAQRHWRGTHGPAGTTPDAVRHDGEESASETELGLDGTDRVSPLGGSYQGIVGGDTRADATASGWVRFDGARRNPVGDGPVAGRVTVSLSWNTSADYDLYLLRKTPTGTVVWQSATTDEGGAERLSTVVPRGRYAVAVGYDGGADRSRLRLFANRRLGTHTAAGSLTAPATADGVIAVGALNENGTGAAAFSSRGPVEGRPGVTLVAPDSAGAGADGGTSFAAPYVAGTVALLQSDHPEVAPTQVGSVVATAAVDVGPEGPDPATGYGRLDAVVADRTLDALLVGTADGPLRGPAAGGVDPTSAGPGDAPATLAEERDRDAEPAAGETASTPLRPA